MAAVVAELGAMGGCDVVAARTGELLLLVTETDTQAADRALRARIEGLEGVRGLLLTFGDIDPDTEDPDPLASGVKANSPSPEARRP